MKVDVLYFKGCPNHAPDVEQVRAALRTEGIEAPVHEVEITDASMAQEVDFPGSPSVRTDELDIEPDARGLQSLGAAGHSVKRYGISRLPEVEGDKPAKEKFHSYPIRFFHLDIAELRSAEGKLYLFVAIDRTSKFAFIQ